MKPVFGAKKINKKVGDCCPRIYWKKKHSLTYHKPPLHTNQTMMMLNYSLLLQASCSPLPPPSVQPSLLPFISLFLPLLYFFHQFERFFFVCVCVNVCDEEGLWWFPLAPSKTTTTTAPLCSVPGGKKHEQKGLEERNKCLVDESNGVNCESNIQTK